MCSETRSYLPHDVRDALRSRISARWHVLKTDLPDKIRYGQKADFAECHRLTTTRRQRREILSASAKRRMILPTRAKRLRKCQVVAPRGRQGELHANLLSVRRFRLVGFSSSRTSPHPYLQLHREDFPLRSSLLFPFTRKGRQDLMDYVTEFFSLLLKSIR